MALTQVKKRNGDIVAFDIDKISNAIKKALVATHTAFTVAELMDVTTRVVQNAGIMTAQGSVTHVEHIQDVVEKELMAHGWFDAAKSYILYRKEHEHERFEEKNKLLEKIEARDISVIKRSGEKEKFDEKKMRGALVAATRGYENVVNIDVLAVQCMGGLHDAITTKDIRKVLVMTVRSFIEQDPAYSFIAARLVLHGLYKEVIGNDIDLSNIAQAYRSAFAQNIHDAIAAGVLASTLATFDLTVLAAALKPERDLLFNYLGIQTLTDRYFARDATNGRIFEAPQSFWMRVAMGIAQNEKEKEKKAIEFYEVMSELHFVPSTPTLFHSGTPHSQMSSCYVNTVEDDLAHIFKCFADNAQLSKWSGGIGTDWTNLRGTGALIKKTGVESQGIIPFLKIANDVTLAINRSGKRRGATCATLETWHYDIEDFLDLRKNTGDERRRTHDMDTANWVPDLFMKRVEADGEWTLFSPDETPDLHHIYGKKFEERYAAYEGMAREGKIRLKKTMKARDLWKKMVTMLFETGHPWITFKDPCNIRSPQDHVGVVHGSNLCTEITLNTSKDETAVCNLGSVNLAFHVKDKKIDSAMIERTVRTAMRMLDNVIDINFYPTPEAKNANMKHRPVGLGVMGFQDALYQMDIRFDSEACVQAADESMELVAYHAIASSAELAKERGAYETYTGSKWDRGIFPQDTIALLEQERGVRIDIPKDGKLDWAPVRSTVQQHGMRNSNCLAIAPTATIANITGATPSIEPVYKNLYVKSNQGGEFIVVNTYLVQELKELGLWDHELLGKIKYHDGGITRIHEIPEHIREKYKEAFEIDPTWIIRAAAQRGKWIDQSQSLNIFFKGSSGRDISNIYMYAWAMGLKTTYYLRTLAVSQVEKSTMNTEEFGSTHKRAADEVVKKPITPTDTPKLCAIIDPTCEACQ
ncbi:MAG: ribonucleoside-diphosphate reductase subunit alpha [Candidatus Azambacteria bacterium]|nr:ribonucleoside-diphosphate reductase subunit alpha [Candidatus Azambacteria bacterium]